MKIRRKIDLILNNLQLHLLKSDNEFIFNLGNKIQDFRILINRGIFDDKQKRFDL